MLLANRRRRAPDEPEVWASHHAVIERAVVAGPEFETDRMAFIGRGRDLRAPLALLPGRTLSGSTGTVLDRGVRAALSPARAAGGTARIAFWTCVASGRTEVLELADKHRDANAHMRAATLAWTQAQVQLRHLGIDASLANLFQQLAGRILYADAAARPPGDAIRRGASGPQPLWSQGISGDLPIVMIRVEDTDDLPVVRQLLQAHEYWGIKRLSVDLVIFNERGASYVQDLQVALESMVRVTQGRPRIAGADTRGQVFVLRADLITSETRGALFAVARVVLSGRRGSLADQMERMQPTPALAPRATRRAASATFPANGEQENARTLEFFNGLGGFAAQGREYTVTAAQPTPAPWINVIANRHFGFHVSAEGTGFTWARNSRENMLTPWSNDPVTDRPGEVIYVRDEESGELWSPTSSPIRLEQAHYSCAHGFGYTRFNQRSHGLALELTLLVPGDDPVKLCRLRIRNDSGRERRLSVTAYVEWVLSPARVNSAAHIITEQEATTGALLARNPWNHAFHGVAFADLGGRQSEWTCDRREFLGRHGALDAPAALLAGTAFSGRTGAALDPCSALRGHVELAPGEQHRIPRLARPGRERGGGP